MQMYLFVLGVLAWTLTIGLLLPLNIGLVYLAFRVNHGAGELDEELAEELWPRSAFAALAFAIACLVFLVLDYAVVEWLGFPAGPAHVVMFFGLFSVGALAMRYCFSLEDFFQGLSIVALYIALPLLVLYPLYWLTQWNPLFDLVSRWLKAPVV